ncbi:SpaA isopeptide-forming pilin-related protein, partial [Pseudolactococcus yaeyamensis]
ADVVNGSQIGTLNGKPVVKAQSNDMASSSFQGTVDGLLASANLDGVRYVADNISWQSNTTLNGGQPLSSFGDSARFTLGQDGFQPSDLAIHIDYDQYFAVMNVGTITDTATGAKIPVSMKVINNGLEHGNDGQTNNDAIFAVRNEGSTVTIGSVTPVNGTDTGGGQSENGGGSGGSVGDGSLVGYLNKNRTTVSLVRTDNGQEIPDNDLLIAMKVSDVDANQLIEVDGNGALGYIVSPDTALSVSGNGLRSTSNGATITDSPLLTPNSYVVLKRFNKSLVDITYLDGAGDHKDLVWALFGYLPFKMNVTGDLLITKTGVESGANMWNGNYTLKGNEFTVKNVLTGKTYTATTDEKGKAMLKGLPVGLYDVPETKASNGFVNSFKTVRVEVKPNGQTALGYNEAKGTNTEIKGENELLKLDKETGTTDTQGKTELKGAEYMLVHDDESTGSSPHKKSDPVKWSEIPAPLLISGTKVTTSTINGKKVNHGDKVVLKVDDVKFNLAIGNLPVGKYHWEEINVPIGYVTDDSELAFEVKKKDDKTENIVTPQTKSLEQAIKIKLLIQKKVEIAGESADSGYNDIKINVTPREGTNADPQTITTGILNDEDGYANFEGIYGDYVITEDPSTLPAGTELFEPIYIHTDTDPETDKITIQATYKAYADEEGAVPLSGRQFSQSDNETDKNESLTGTVAGAVSSKVPFISLSKIVLTDKATPLPPETPSIDVEKSSEPIPQAGQGNNSDKADNLGKGDADTPETAVKVGDKETPVYYRITNNGTERWSKFSGVDKTLDGKPVKNVQWTYQGKPITINKNGWFELNGKLLGLDVDEYVEATGTLEKLADGETHSNEIVVKAIGAISGKEVTDSDKWHAVKPKTPETPKKPETPAKPAEPSLPMTGEQATKLATIIGSLIVAVIAIVKHKVILEALASVKAKIKK